MTRQQRDTLVGVGGVLLFVFGCWFLAVLVGSTSGEAAAALEGVVRRM